VQNHSLFCHQQLESRRQLLLLFQMLLPAA
jgi:hypothetical protein